MNQLIEYLKQNKIYFKEIDNNFIEIDSKKYFLVKPIDGLLFSDNFILIADENCDRYVYCFGGNWYWEEHDDYDKPKLNELRYIGSTTSPLRTDCFLGVRGGYELLNGSRTYEDWVKKAKFMECKTLGICEKNTLAGTLKFQLACQKEGIKSIIGATYTIFREDKDFRYDIKIYVQNGVGWQNLLLINKEVNVINNKFIHEKRFFELLEGLIIVIDPKSIDFDDLFPLDLNDIYYQLDTVEFTNNDSDKKYLLNLKKFLKSDLQPIATTDAFYLEKEHSHIKKLLNSIGGLSEQISFNQYFKDKEDYYSELEKLFNIQDESFFDYFEPAVKNEAKVSNQCTFKISTGNRFLPKYEMTEDEKSKFETNEDLFWFLIEKGLKDRKKDSDVYLDRINIEFNVIEKGNVIDYFLILWDIIQYAKANDILVGVGRGSAGGSIISYFLQIIQLDPIQFDLLFERFLNEGRIVKSLPDIDTDFPGEKRELIKKYMQYKYGINQVCSVGTYTQLQVKSAIKDLGRIHNLSFGDINQLTTILPNMKSISELFQFSSKNSRVKSFLKQNTGLINDIMLVLHQPKAKSIHACAMLILPKDKDMYNWLPISNIDNQMVSEWEGPELEEAGFLKEDILGIKQLDKFENIINLIKVNKGKVIDIYSIPLNDKKVFDLFSKGFNQDVFHFGSPGLTGYCKELNPSNIEDLIAGISLYRPGAMENNFHNEYILRKNNERKTEYFTGSESILNKTYGVFVYQEQIMKLCQVLGGLSLVEADDVRKAMVKKKFQELTKYKERFIPYYIENFNVTKEYSEHVWDTIDKASTYLFNRCISGEEKLKSMGCHFKYDIGQMWKLRNIKNYHKKLGLSNNYFGVEYGNSYSLNNDLRLRRNKIKDIRFVGIKPIFRMTLENGEYIDVTDNHKFPTNNGEKMLKSMKIGEDKIYFNIGYVQEDTDYRFTDKAVNNPNYNKGSVQEIFKLNSVKGVEGFISKGETGFKIFDNYKKNLKKNFCEICNKSECRLEAHHKNGITSDNFEDNFITLCSSCHKKEHYKLGRTKISEKGLYTILLNIKSIEFLKEGEVYDVEMEAPNHTFTTNKGIVTSNSHAAAYAITGYISQWFKVNYPLEFWSTAFKFSEEKDHANYISEINLTGNIKVMPADINKSRDDVFTDFETKTICWPLVSIKQCGDKAASQIIEVRDKDGEYFSFEEFLSRNKFVGSKVNKAVIENLIISGAFDNLERLRTYKDRMELVIFYRNINKVKIDSDKDLFYTNTSKINEDWWWTLQQKQLSGIAFFDYNSILERYLKHDVYIIPVEDFQNDILSTRKEKVKIGGYIVEVEEKSSKKGKWCRLLLESNYTFIWVTIWNEQYKQIEDLNLQEKLKSILLISGEVIWDTYRKENILQANNDTEILVLD